MEVEVRVAFHSLDSGRTSLLLALRQGLNCRSTHGKPLPVVHSIISN